MRTGTILLMAAMDDKTVMKKYTTDDMLTMLALAFVKLHGMALKWIDSSLCNDELYHIAVAQDGHAIQFVSEHLRTGELCLLAVKQNGNAFRHLMRRHYSVELHLEALRNPGHGTYLHYDLLDAMCEQFDHSANVVSK